MPYLGRGFSGSSMSGGGGGSSATQYFQSTLDASATKTFNPGVSLVGQQIISIDFISELPFQADISAEISGSNIIVRSTVMEAALEPFVVGIGSVTVV